MLFDTPAYFLFLTIVVLSYWRLRWRAQNVLLLGASYFFYAWWDWRFLLLLVSSSVFDYVSAQKIEDSASTGRRKAWLIGSLALNLVVLGFFKYFNFFIDSTVTVLEALGFNDLPRNVLTIVLPFGISFYTFQAIAYIVDVYRRELPASRRFVDYGLFISLFPHLIAGPIQRPSHLLPQVQQPRVFNSSVFRDGCMLILTGLVRKTVVADNCAHLANAAFTGKLGTDGWATVIGTYAFAWQIYGDFSGYSDMARGSAQLLGFHFMVNFRQPYLSVDLRDFWRRWHISLSTWLRDYLYIALGGSRGSALKTYRNLMATMVIGGLWHGANWTFVVWGFIHGLGLSFERFLFGHDARRDAARGWRKWVKVAITFHLVCLAWIFFRADSLSSAVTMIGRLAQFQWSANYAAALTFLAILVTLASLIDWKMERAGTEYPFQNESFTRRLAGAVTAIALVILFAASEGSAFIYFQF